MKIFVEDYRLGFSEAGIERAWVEWVTQKRAGMNRTGFTGGPIS
jgi:hypothetical protein